MLVQVFCTLVNNPAAQHTDIRDVADDAWYAQAAEWAVSTGIVSGAATTWVNRTPTAPPPGPRPG